MLATWWRQATPGTTYWRCDVPARALPGQVLQLRNESLVDEYDGVRLVGQEGASIWQFPGNATRALIMAHLQTENVAKVLVEVDDNYLLAAPHRAGFASEWQARVDRTPEDRYSHEAHARIVQWVDGVIVTTPTLAEQYASATTAPIYVCPNSVDLDDWPEPFEKQSEVFCVGYAGSDSHVHDVTLIKRALSWAADQRKTMVWKIGLGNVHWTFPHEIFPWANDLAVYRKNLQVLDVGLCPLKRSPWHDAKSDIKAIEYALSGALPIVQADSPCYADWIDVVPSASTETEWRRIVKWAVNSPDDVKEMAKKARQFVLDQKLIAHHIDKWKEAVSASERHELDVAASQAVESR